MVPTVGRIVLYTNLGDKDGRYPPEQQAALVTKVVPREVEKSPRPEEADYTVSLHIFYATGQFDMQDVPFAPEFQRGHWTWMPKI